MPTSAPFLPVTGLRHLAESRGTDGFAGGTAAVAPDLFVQLLYPSSVGGGGDGIVRGTSTTGWPIADVVLRCLGQCNALRGKTSTACASLVMHQVCALVEHVFTVVLPPPPTIVASTTAASGVWGPSNVDLALQRRVLQVC